METLFTFGKFKGKTFQDVSSNPDNITVLEKMLGRKNLSEKSKSQINAFFNALKGEEEPEIVKSDEKGVFLDLEPVKDFSKYDICNKKYDKIYHMADIHIRLMERHEEYLYVFNQTYNFLREEVNKGIIGIIVICGDIFHNKNQLTPECVDVCKGFLAELGSIMDCIIIAGNHDAVLSNKDRMDTLYPIMNLKGGDKNDYFIDGNIYYLRNSGLYDFGNLVFGVFSLFDEVSVVDFDKIEGKKYVGLYHGGVGACETDVGFRLKGEKLVEEFKDYDIVCLGDIHRHQFIGDGYRVAYSGSLIQQDFGENNNFHGVLIWNVSDWETDYKEIKNKWGFHTVNIEDDDNIKLYCGEYCFEEFIDINLNKYFNERNFVRFVVKENCKELFLKVKSYLEKKIFIEKLNVIIEPDLSVVNDIKLNENTDVMEMIKDYCAGMNYDSEIVIGEIKGLDSLDFEKKMKVENWKLEYLEFDNLFGYGSGNRVNFAGIPDHIIVGCFANNSYGKSTIIDILSFTLFGKVVRHSGHSVCRDLINVHENNFRVKLGFSIGGVKYEVFKEGKRETKGSIKITGQKFWKFGDDNVKEDLSGEDRIKTDEKIREVIGSLSQFLLTSVQLQSNDKNFRGMSALDKKKFLVDILNLDVFESIKDEIKKNYKELKRNSDVLTKFIEELNIGKILSEDNENRERLGEVEKEYEGIIKRRSQITWIGDVAEKEAFIERRNELMNMDIDWDIDEKEIIEENNRRNEEMKKANLRINELNCLKGKYVEIDAGWYKKFPSVKNLKISGSYVRDLKVNKIKELIQKWKNKNEEMDDEKYDKVVELEGIKKWIEENSVERKNNHEKFVKEKEADMNDLVKKREMCIYKMTECNEELVSEYDIVKKSVDKNDGKYNWLKDNVEKLVEYQKDLEKLQYVKGELEKDIEALKKHEYNPDCKFCVKNNVVVKGEESRKKLKEINNEINGVQGDMEVMFVSGGKVYKGERVEKVIKEWSIIKKEYERDAEKLRVILEEKEKMVNNKKYMEELTNLRNEISKVDNRKDEEWNELVVKDEKRCCLEEQIDRLEIDIGKNKNKIRDFDEYCEVMEVNNSMSEIIEEEKLLKGKLKEMEKIDFGAMIKECYEVKSIKEELAKCEERIGNVNSDLIAEFNEINSKYDELKEERIRLNLLIKSGEEKKEAYNKEKEKMNVLSKRVELYKFLNDMFGKNGISQYLLKNYLPLIEKKVNKIIIPYINREIKLEMEDDRLLLQSFLVGVDKSVEIHGGMEGFIMDLAFKIVLSQIAILPKSDFLIIDEGISAFDKEHLGQIESLFEFIRSNFSKVLLISHIEGIKDYVPYQIEINKNNKGQSFIYV